MKGRQEIGEMTGFFEAHRELKKKKKEKDEDQSHDGWRFFVVKIQKWSSGVFEASWEEDDLSSHISCFFKVKLVCCAGSRSLVSAYGRIRCIKPTIQQRLGRRERRGRSVLSCHITVCSYMTDKEMFNPGSVFTVQLLDWTRCVNPLTRMVRQCHTDRSAEWNVQIQLNTNVSRMKSNMFGIFRNFNKLSFTFLFLLWCSWFVWN